MRGLHDAPKDDEFRKDIDFDGALEALQRLHDSDYQAEIYASVDQGRVSDTLRAAQTKIERLRADRDAQHRIAMLRLKQLEELEHERDKLHALLRRQAERIAGVE